MEDKIKITCKVYEPRLNGNGYVISPEVMDEAVKEFMSSSETKLVHMDRGDDINQFQLTDAIGTLDHIERKEDESLWADCTVYSNIPKGKIIAEALKLPLITQMMMIEPQGYYDKENEKLTIVGYSIKLQTDDNKGKDNQEA